MQELKIINGTDMNATLNPTLDRSSPRDQHSRKLATVAFQGLLSDFSLI